MKNKAIADLLTNLGILLEIQGENIFKIKAYYKAADNILALGEDIEALCKEDRLGSIPGVGQAIRDKIKEYLETGRMKAFDEVTQQIPASVLELVSIPSVGPKKAKLFYDELKVKSLAELKTAVEAGRLEGLPGIKEKTIENIIKGIKIVSEGQERMNLGTASEIADKFIEALDMLPEVKQISVAGSLRRGCETIRDIDILIDSSDPKKIMDAFVKFPGVKSINAHGETKSSILTNENVQVDLRVVDNESFGAALLYFTGSKNFNIKIRQIAQEKEMKVNEYGVFSVKGEKEKCLARKTEEECLKALGLPYIPPELREDIGEKELFGGDLSRPLPALIEVKDIKGDLHTHSTWSDGQNTIEDMAKTAQALGYEYIGISDHSQSLRVAGGLSVEDLKKKKKEIDAVNKKLKNFRVLFGTEVEIDSDGNLDYNEAVLSAFDVVIASVHSGFTQKREQLTRRIVKACQNKYVTIIGHPTGIHIGKRESYDVDLKEICKAAKDYNVYLEINAFPIRLDLNSQNTYFARSQGVNFSINTDAHHRDHLHYMRFGISVARRGWLSKRDVLNTRSLNEIEKILKK